MYIIKMLFISEYLNQGCIDVYVGVKSLTVLNQDTPDLIALNACSVVDLEDQILSKLAQ
jgi:hypothetical protein